MFDYVKYYKEYYHIHFDKSYHIHHIDLDKKNNEISNLILLPSDLHIRYHYILKVINNNCKESKQGLIDFRISSVLFNIFEDTSNKMLPLIPKLITDCQQWISLKDHNYNNSKFKETIIKEI